MKVRRPNAQVIPHDIFNFLMPDVDNLAELKVIFFIAHQTSGRGKEWDWISQEQFRTGIVRRRDRKQINEGTGLATSSIRQGIERALEHKHILRRYTCRSCRNIVEKTEVIERAYKTRHGEGTTKIREVPERCPHCQNKLRGNYCAEYSLNWLDDEKTTKESLEVTTTPLVVAPTTRLVVDPLRDSLSPTTQLVLTEELTEERYTEELLQQSAEKPKPESRNNHYPIALREYEKMFGLLGGALQCERFGDLWDDFPSLQIHEYARGQMYKAMMRDEKPVSPNLRYYAKCLETGNQRNWVEAKKAEARESNEPDREDPEVIAWLAKMKAGELAY